MTTLEEIKARFPNPQTLDHEGEPGAYCIGGAVVSFIGNDEEEMSSWFPFDEHVIVALCSLNPHLDKAVSQRLTVLMIQRNDLGDFPGAWRCVASALKYPSEDY